MTESMQLVKQNDASTLISKRTCMSMENGCPGRQADGRAKRQTAEDTNRRVITMILFMIYFFIIVRH